MGAGWNHNREEVGEEGTEPLQHLRETQCVAVLSVLEAHTHTRRVCLGVSHAHTCCSRVAQ